MSNDNLPAYRRHDDIYAGLDPKTRAELEGMEREARRLFAKLDVDFMVDHNDMNRDAVTGLRKLQEEFEKTEARLQKEFERAEVEMDRETVEALERGEPEAPADQPEIEAAATKPDDKVDETEPEVDEPDHKVHRPHVRFAP